MRHFDRVVERRWGRAIGFVGAGVIALFLALPGFALGSANDVRVRFTGAMETFHQPNAQPSNDEIVNIRKYAWDLVWHGTVSQLDGSALGKPRVLLATGQALTTFTDRAPCRATLAYIPANGPFAVVIRREGQLDVGAINTTWNANYIDSTPEGLACFDPSNGFAGGTLSTRAFWVPAQPLVDPSATTELQGVQHLTTAIFRFNRETPSSTIPFSWTYTTPSGTGGDPGMEKIVWFGRVQIQTDPQGTPKPTDLSGLLPGSSGFGAPGNPPPPTGIGGVTGDLLLSVLDQVANDWVGSITRRAADAAAKRKITVQLPPPEAWAEPGRLTARLCIVPRTSKARKCSTSQSIASANVNVRGTPAGGAGSTPARSATTPPLVFRTTAAAVSAVHAARAVLIEDQFTGSVTHRTVNAHHTFTKR
jgi:hypothetical protein